MGVITEAPERKDEGPQCPFIFMDVLDIYRELKFVRRITDDSIKLIARELITWQDLMAYQTATRRTLSILETELIMGLEAIFEGRDNG